MPLGYRNGGGMAIPPPSLRPAFGDYFLTVRK